MPNWCANHVTLRHADPAMIAKAEEGFNKDEFFHTLVPMPEELKGTSSPNDKPNPVLVEKYGADNWYDWSVANWGTKWDANSGDGAIADQSEGSITLVFDTAWSPPITFYTKLEEMGWQVKAYYFEPGMMFCGIYEDGDDEYFEVGEDEIPDELEDIFDISSWINDEDE